MSDKNTSETAVGNGNRKGVLDLERCPQNEGGGEDEDEDEEPLPKMSVYHIIGWNPRQESCAEVPKYKDRNFELRVSFQRRGKYLNYRLMEEAGGDGYELESGTGLSVPLTYDGFRVVVARLIHQYPRWKHVHVWYRGRELCGEEGNILEI